MKVGKKQQELIDKSIDLGLHGDYPLFKGIYIVQRRELHDSGYRMMYVIGHTEYDEKEKDFKYYLLATSSDVISLEPLFRRFMQYEMCDLHLDIDRDGLIHIWTNSTKRFRCIFSHISTCQLEIV